MSEEHKRYHLYQRTQSFPLARFQRDILERIVIAVMLDEKDVDEICGLDDESLYQKILLLCVKGWYG